MHEHTHARAHKHTHTVSPVEKLTNRTTGTLPVRSRCGRSTVAVRSWCGRGYRRGTVEVPSRYRRGTVHTVEVRSRCVRRYSLGTLPVRSLYRMRYTQGSFPPCILDAPRAWYTYCSFYCSNRAIAASWIRLGHRYYTFNTERIVSMV